MSKNPNMNIDVVKKISLSTVLKYNSIGFIHISFKFNIFFKK